MRWSEIKGHGFQPIQTSIFPVTAGTNHQANRLTGGTTPLKM
jgi:hypothetical protein